MVLQMNGLSLQLWEEKEGLCKYYRLDMAASAVKWITGPCADYIVAVGLLYHSRPPQNTMISISEVLNIFEH